MRRISTCLAGSVRVVAPPCLPRQLDVFFLIDDSNCLYGAVLNAVRRGGALMADVQGSDALPYRAGTRLRRPERVT